MSDKVIKGTIELNTDSVAQAARNAAQAAKDYEALMFQRRLHAAGDDQAKLAMIAAKEAMQSESRAAKELAQTYAATEKMKAQAVKEATAAAEASRRAAETGKSAWGGFAGVAGDFLAKLGTAAIGAAAAMGGLTLKLASMGAAREKAIGGMEDDVARLGKATGHLIDDAALGKIAQLGKNLNLSSRETDAIAKASLALAKAQRVDVAQAIDAVTRSAMTGTSEGLTPLGMRMAEVTNKAHGQSLIIRTLTDRYGDMGVSAHNSAQSLTSLSNQMRDGLSEIGRSISESRVYKTAIDDLGYAWGMLSKAITGGRQEGLRNSASDLARKQWNQAKEDLDESRRLLKILRQSSTADMLAVANTKEDILRLEKRELQEREKLNQVEMLEERQKQAGQQKLANEQAKSDQFKLAREKEFARQQAAERARQKAMTDREALKSAKPGDGWFQALANELGKRERLERQSARKRLAIERQTAREIAHENEDAAARIRFAHFQKARSVVLGEMQSRAALIQTAAAHLASGGSVAQAIGMTLQALATGWATKSFGYAAEEAAMALAAQGFTWGVPNPASMLHWASAGKWTALGVAATTGAVFAGKIGGDSGGGMGGASMGGGQGISSAMTMAGAGKSLGTGGESGSGAMGGRAEKVVNILVGDYRGTLTKRQRARLQRAIVNGENQ